MSKATIVSGETGYNEGFKYFVAVEVNGVQVSRTQTDDVNELPIIIEHTESMLHLYEVDDLIAPENLVSELAKVKADLITLKQVNSYLWVVLAKRTVGLGEWVTWLYNDSQGELRTLLWR